jgi:hypothetical protein
MRWKIIVVNAGIVLVACLLTYVLLMTSLREVVSNAAERKREVAQALRAANAQLALDALRLEQWLARQVRSSGVREVYLGGTPQARSEGATAQANRIRDAAVAEADFAKMSPSLVLFVDETGTALGRNGSALMRGDSMGKAYPSLAAALEQGVGGSAIWLNRERQEQMLVSYAPVSDERGDLVGAVAVGTPLNDERLSRTSDLTSGHALIFGVPTDNGLELVADSGNTPDMALVVAAQPSVVAAAHAAAASGTLANASEKLADYYFGALKLSGYDGARAVLLTAVPASLVGNLASILWPVFGVGVLALVLVIVGGALLGNYIQRPISELEDGLLAIINGNQDLRFQLEHPDLGGLVFRINSLLNAFAGVPEDTTDDEGRPSVEPSGRDFSEALSVDESYVTTQAVDPAVLAKLVSEPPDQYYARLFREYVAAKRELGDPVDHIQLEGFRFRIEGSEQEIAQKHGRPVRYQVKLRDGSVVLIAVPLVGGSAS